MVKKRRSLISGRMDEEAVALISLRGEMNDEFNRNLKKQGMPCIVLVSFENVIVGLLQLLSLPLVQTVCSD